MSSLDTVNYIPIEKLIDKPRNFSPQWLKPILDKTAETYPKSAHHDSSRLVYTRVMYRIYSDFYKITFPSTFSQEVKIETIDKVIIEDLIHNNDSLDIVMPFLNSAINTDHSLPVYKIKGLYMMNGCVVGIKTGHSQYFNLLWGKDPLYIRSFLKIYTAINNLEEEITSKRNIPRNALNIITNYINKL